MARNIMVRRSMGSSVGYNRIDTARINRIDTSGRTVLFQVPSPPSNILLADVDVAILVATGSRLLGS